ncbi:MAG TPA: YtxH domain-containing protein [Gemmatimonadaceae bacterium]|nr:YtxH domain-containing protein [Gemmatimonadaceae bacterium]
MAYAGKSGEAGRLRPTANSLSHNNSRPIGRTAAGVAVGLLVGAGIALMFAPQDGWESRRRLRRGLRRARHHGMDAWDELSAEFMKARRKLRRARRRAALVADDVEDVVD